MFNINENALLLPAGFPALAGITTRWASQNGDFGYGNFQTPAMEIEYQQSRILARQISGDSNFGKILPEETDTIFFSDDCHGYARAKAMIEYNPKARKTPLTLMAPTNDCPIIVFSSLDHKLIGIAQSDAECCKQKIIGKSIGLIEEKAKLFASQKSDGETRLLTAKDIYVGIFPGICGRCNKEREEIGSLFPKAYHDGNLDLKKIILHQLFMAGIMPQKIAIAQYCACCTPGNGEYPFFSRHRDGHDQSNAVFIAGI